MNAPAALRAVYTDYRRVKGRKTHQIIFEIPSELWPEAYKVLGEPSIENSDWWALAKLKSEAEPEPAEPKWKTKFSRLRPSTQAALLCERPSFWNFLKDELHGGNIDHEDEAAAFVRSYCQVNSRSDFDRSEDAARSWFELRDQFDAWINAGG